MIVDAVVKVGAEDLESSMMRKKRVLDERLEQARSAADAKKQGVKKPGGSTNRVRAGARTYAHTRTPHAYTIITHMRARSAAAASWVAAAVLER